MENGGKRLLRVRVLVNGEEVAQGEDFSKKRLNRSRPKKKRSVSWYLLKSGRFRRADDRRIILRNFTRMKSRVGIDENEQYGFVLIGIVCQHRDYRLLLEINLALDISLCA